MEMPDASSDVKVHLDERERIAHNVYGFFKCLLRHPIGFSVHVSVVD